MSTQKEADETAIILDMGIGQFALKFIARTLGITLGVGLVTVVSLFAASEIGPEALKYSIVTILAFGALLAQHSILEETDTVKETSVRFQIASVVFGLLYYNTLVIVGTSLGLAFSNEVGAVFGLVVAVAYPVWEKSTIQHAIPLSVGGIVVWIAAILIAIRSLGGTIVSRLLEVDWSAFIDRGQGLMHDIEHWPTPLFYGRVKNLR